MTPPRRGGRAGEQPFSRKFIPGVSVAISFAGDFLSEKYGVRLATCFSWRRTGGEEKGEVTPVIRGYESTARRITD